MILECPKCRSAIKRRKGGFVAVLVSNRKINEE